VLLHSDERLLEDESVRVLDVHNRNTGGRGNAIVNDFEALAKMVSHIQPENSTHKCLSDIITKAKDVTRNSSIGRSANKLMQAALYAETWPDMGPDIHLPHSLCL
jgi:hypothetical protein